MDIGMLVLDQVLGEEYGEVCAKADTHAQLAAAEAEALGATHAEVGGMLAAQWRLPPLLTVPIGQHDAPQAVEDAALRKMAELVGLSGACADVFVDEQAADAIARVRAACLAQYGMAEADADALLDEVGKRTREVASLFEMNIGSPAAFDAILKKANEALVEITLQSQQQATQFRRQATSLAEVNETLKKQASTDALTELNNRARFDAFLAEQFAAAAAAGRPLSMLLLDVDKFKGVNDRYGHPAGDAVLKALAQILNAAARAGDLAARYGGEELVLVLPNTSRPTAAATAESIRRAIAARPITCGTATLPVTASIGVASYEPGCPFREPAHLLKAADLAVYAAKRAGRNCVRVFALSRPASAPQAAVA
jgi:diguanylate cyclase (GGDEF)-like protein